MADRKEQFRTELIQNCAKAAALGVRSPRLESNIAKHGGVETMREGLRRNRVSDVFEGLKKLGRLELSPEALVIQGKYADLFTDEEADFCLFVLQEANYFQL